MNWFPDQALFLVVPLAWHRELQEWPAWEPRAPVVTQARLREPTRARRAGLDPAPVPEQRHTRRLMAGSVAESLNVQMVNSMNGCHYRTVNGCHYRTVRILQASSGASLEGSWNYPFCPSSADRAPGSRHPPAPWLCHFPPGI